MSSLILNEKKVSRDTSIKGYNIRLNCRVITGQTVAHCHVHLIQRRKGEVENSRAGIRYVINGRVGYNPSVLLKSESL